MFAPGAETVKERAIHTAIGVGHYIRQGPLAVQDPNPLGPPVVVGLCGNCQHVETANPNSPACPVCGVPAGTGDRDYQEIGRAHVWTPVTNAHLVCRLLLETKQRSKT